MMWNVIVVALLIVFAVQTSHSKSISAPFAISRIRNGTFTTVEEHPYMVRLLMGPILQPYLTCGATLITSTHILTAAHCFITIKQSEVSAIAGTSNIIDGGQQLEVLNFVTHENFNIISGDLDVAIVTLAHPVEGKNIRPIEIDFDETPQLGDIVTASGWGRTHLTQNDDDGYDRNLSEVDMPVANCNKTLSIGNQEYQVTENFFCAGRVDGKGICTGDSGGPLIYNGKQVGVSSMGDRCSSNVKDHARIGIFVKLSSPPVVDFIRKHTGLGGETAESRVTIKI